jgi:HPt (histidine-containing phosphotransfer) domain-containing protein
MSEAIERIKARFATEAAATLSEIASAIEELSAGGGRQEAAGRIREQAHGLKGAAAVLEFEEFRDRSAALENAAAELVVSDQWPPDAVGRLGELLASAHAALPQVGQ